MTARLTLERPWLSVRTEAPVRVLSWALNRPGFTTTREIVWREVRNADLQVGDMAPDLRLRDHTGRTIELSDYLGEKNVVLAFLPGAFTPK